MVTPDGEAAAALLARLGASDITRTPDGVEACPAPLEPDEISAIHPWLFTDGWLGFGDLLRSPVPIDGIVRNLGLQSGYTAVFVSAAWARMHERDVTT